MDGRYVCVRKTERGLLGEKDITLHCSIYLQFCHDMRLMFDNAWLYNRKTSKVYRYCTKLSEVFEANIDQAMQSLGYCCGQKVHTHVNN